MENNKILFIVPCNLFFPSGIVRVFHYFPYFDKDNIKYRSISYYSAISQQLLHWLNRSIFHKNKWSDLFLRVIFHLIGIPHQIFCLLLILTLSSQYGILFIQATIFPIWYSKILHWFYEKIIFDLDDAYYLQNTDRVICSIEAANHIIVGSHSLYAFAKNYNNKVVLIPSSIPMERYEKLSREKENDTLCIGWIGGNSSVNQLSLLVNPIIYLLDNHYNFEILLAGTDNLKTPLHNIPGLRIVEIPKYNDNDIPKIVSAIDIGVMPLENTLYNQGRCSYKLLIYMASAVPSISSPVGEVNQIINNGKNGFLAKSTEEWISSIIQLIKNPVLRKELSNNGTETILDGYSIEKSYALLKNVILR